jgi:6-phospho-3-hexuloisomerase
MEPFSKVAQELLDEITGMLTMVDPGTYTSLVNHLLSAKSVVVAGDGRSRYVMGTFARRLSQMGRTVSVEGESAERSAGRGDILLVASLTGERGALTGLAESARRAGARVCAFVGEISSVLSSHADYVVAIAPQTRTPFESIAGAGRASALAFDEALMIYLDAVLLSLEEVLHADRDTIERRPG